MFAAVDMGSNSFRLHIGKHEEGAIRIIKSAREPNRLAAGLDADGFLTAAAIQGGVEALKRLSSILSAFPVAAVRSVATNTLRIARNAPEFLQAAERALGHPIEVISGEEEGRLIYMGVANVLAEPDERRLVIDIGGGSTELILGKGQEIERVESFSIGTVRQSLSFFPEGKIDQAAFDAAILSARSHFEDVAPFYHSRNWKSAYGSSGTVRAIAEIVSCNGLGKGGLSLNSLTALKDGMIGFGSIDRLQFDGLKAGRTASVVGGLAVLIALVQELKIELVNPVEAGLRMGVMWDLCLQATRRDRREQSVREFQHRYHADEMRAGRVADDALALYRAMKPSSEVYGKNLYWSALLHEVGMFVSPTNHHKHGAYLIENADLAGFSARDQRKMSRLILGQKGNLRKLDDTLTEPDALKAVLALRLAVMFMHARVAVDLKLLSVKTQKRIDLLIKGDWLAGHPTLSYWLERERDWWDEVGIDFAVRN